MNKNKLLFYFTKTSLLVVISLISIKPLYSVPNAGSLLNVEEEIRKVNILPTQVPEDKELINGISGTNGEKIKVNGFQFDGQTNGFTNEQLSQVIKDLIGKNLTFDEIQNAAKRMKIFIETRDIF